MTLSESGGSEHLGRMHQGGPPPKSGRGRDYRLAIPGRGRIWAACLVARRGLGCRAEWSL